jgi:peptidoglycan hydrolase-like protein with peptidoglycan-binding domain
MPRVKQPEVRKLRPLQVVAGVAAAGLSLAISYNALLAQQANHGLAAGDLPPGATTHVEVSANGVAPNTIQLKYDPMIEDVQRELQSSGFYRGQVDGVVGRKTRDAIVAYQRLNGLNVNGQPTQALIDHIRYTRQVAAATLFTGSVDPAPNAEQRARVRRVQTALSEMAYLQDSVTGELNGPTQMAIRQFEHDHGMVETGIITDGLMLELTKVSGQTSTLKP